jgi:hypothetical protein
MTAPRPFVTDAELSAAMRALDPIIPPALHYVVVVYDSAQQSAQLCSNVPGGADALTPIFANLMLAFRDDSGLWIDTRPQ